MITRGGNSSAIKHENADAVRAFVQEHAAHTYLINACPVHLNGLSLPGVNLQLGACDVDIRGCTLDRLGMDWSNGSVSDCVIRKVSISADVTVRIRGCRIRQLQMQGSKGSWNLLLLNTVAAQADVLDFDTMGLDEFTDTLERIFRSNRGVFRLKLALRLAGYKGYDRFEEPTYDYED